METVETSLAETAGVAAEAKAYDRWFDEPWGGYAFAVEARALLTAAGPLSGQAALDVGCGTGRFTSLLAEAGARVTGLDLDAAMLGVATGRVPGRLVLGDAAHLPFPNGQFDLVAAVTLCEFTADVERVFAELARVTRPGGRFIVGALNPASAWGLAHRRRFRRPPWTRARFLTRAALLRLGQRFGSAALSAHLYAPGAFPGLAVAGPVLEAAGRVVPRLGAFQVLVVQRGGA